MSAIDLHIHSSVSDDGELSPAEIVALSATSGMRLIAITDHNSVRGVKEAILAASPGTVVLTGVELDCTIGGRGFHLLGYGFDPRVARFFEIEEDILLQERAAGREKIRRFSSSTGIPLPEEEIMKAAPGGVVTGELIGETLFGSSAREHPLLRPYLPGGERSDMPAVRFYWDFFAEGKAAYVPINYIPLEQAVELIHSAGGIAVLAHPGQNLGSDEEALLPKIIAAGIDGLEAYSSYHTSETAEHYKETARRHGLLVTCGSDFHGKHKPQIGLGGHGSAISDEELMADLEKRLLERA